MIRPTIATALRNMYKDLTTVEGGWGCGFGIWGIGGTHRPGGESERDTPEACGQISW